jgi:KUP system potassium uptake protein
MSLPSTAAKVSSSPQPAHVKPLGGNVIAALGVVYGDIGTSPLYAMQKCFGAETGVTAITEDIFGILSLILWSLLIVVTVKYVLFILRADNRGEGGIFSLMALAMQKRGDTGAMGSTIISLGMVGAALFYGDGIITPAVSVLSAVEGIQLEFPKLAPLVAPFTIAVIVGLFLMQSRGTDKVGRYFGPVMLLWFLTIAVIGVVNIAPHPEIFAAIIPSHAVMFMIRHAGVGFITLGLVFLAVTGGEALYADMGHFGRSPIRRAWFVIVLPALMLNYFGQGALLLANPDAVNNPFYLAAPDWARLPLVGLATLATVIASQAVISGAFSLSRQAVQLGFLPRLEVQHTSEFEIGQIYVPRINWLLMFAVIFVVVLFRNSDNLAAAYGISVSGTMVITTALTYIVARDRWGWSRLKAASLFGGFLFIDMIFVISNMMKVLEGGWFPLAVAAMLIAIMSTWRRGRAILFNRLHEATMPLELFLTRVTDTSPQRVDGTAVFLTGSREGVPYAMLHNLKHNKIIHRRVVLLTIQNEEVPRMRDDERIEIHDIGKGFWRIIVRYGFAEGPNIPRVLERCSAAGGPFDLMTTSFFLGRERLVRRVAPLMARWRENLFISLSRHALSATEFFRVPANRVVELGTQIEL